MPSVADAIVSRLREAGVRSLFGVPGGGSSLDLIEAAGHAGIPFVLTATETAGAIAAIAQAELSGAPGVVVTGLGPGAASVVNGVACAHLDRAPLIVLTDCHPASAADYAHQRLDQRALFAPITKWSATLDVESAGETVDRAIATAASAPQGPVHLDVPTDVVSARLELPRAVTRTSPEATGAAPPPAEDSFSRPRRPLLLVGLGARSAGDAAAIRMFAERHNVPAMVTYKAKGVVADSDPRFAGVFTNGAIERPIVEDADLVIAVGLDPVELLPRPWAHRQPVVYCGRWRIDGRHIPAGEQIVGDVGTALQEIGRRLGRAEWHLDHVQRAVAEQRRCLTSHADLLTPDAVVRAAYERLSGARVTVDAGAHMFPATILWPVAEPGGMLISNGLSTMGFAVPAAIGAALADRDRRVVALTGDGGLLMCAGELVTIVRERLAVVVIVFSDASLSLIDVKQRQRRFRGAGVSLGDIGWASIAESVRMPAAVATTPEELDAALANAASRRGPMLIDARIDPSAYDAVLRAVRG